MAGRARLAAPAIAASIGIAVLCGLGAWQIERLHWKEALIARVESRLAAHPVAAPGPDAWPAFDLAEAEYTPVAVVGRFDNAREIHVVYTLSAPLGPMGGQGYMVMTPLTTPDGWTVFVNRGFVPRDREQANTRTAGLIEGETRVVGLLRQPSRRAWYMPGDGVLANHWLSRDPALYAPALGLPPDRVAPYIIDARFEPGLPGGLPQGGETIVSFPNSHFGYAITWFGLAVALAGVFAVFAWRRLSDAATGKA